MKTKNFIEPRSRVLKSAIIAFILLLAIARSWYGTRLDSFANDEPFHIVAGAYYAQTGDYCLNPEHPPLSKLWVGLWNNNLKLRPLKVLDDKKEERKWLQEIMYFENDDNLSQSRSRWAMYSFHFVLGLVIALLLWHIFGFWWAVVSIIWLALDPSIGAHQPLVLTDLPLSLTLILSALTATKLVSAWKWKWAIAFGVSAGMALAVKHSALPGLAAIILLSVSISLIPIFQKNFKLVANRCGKLCIAGMLALTVLWATYGFQYHSSANGQDTFNRSLELKIDDLNLRFSKTVINYLNSSQLFPKAYVWGLADTIRAGIEGRGGKYHLFFGEIIEGRASLLYFPGVIISKIPLALLVMVLFAFGLLGWAFWRRFKSRDSILNDQQWLAVLFVFAFICAHLAVLAMGRATYGGIRHALPVVTGLGMLAGAIVLLRIPKFRRYSALIPASLFGLTLIMTISEKRIYEYHNEIVGGTENAYKYFANEGLYLGQRFHETKAFFDRPDIDSTEPINAWSWYMEEEWESENFDFDVDAVKDIHDDGNEEGIQKGYYLIGMSTYIRWPNWDPKDIENLKTVKRIGNINIAYGEFKDPKNWAYSMYGKVMKYVTETKDPDWTLVAKRLKKVTEMLDWTTTGFVVLGNAYIRTDRKEEAIKAYQKAQENMDATDPYQQTLTDQISAVEKTDDLTQIKNLRPASFE